MAERLVRRVLVGVVIVILGIVGWAVGGRLVADAQAEGDQRRRGDSGPAAVAVAPVTTGAIAERLTIAGTLEPSARTILVPEVGGRLVALGHDIGDTVHRGEVVARIDDRRYAQAVAAAEAAVAVAEARLEEATSAVGVARSESERSATLADRGVVATAQHERDRAALQAAEAAVAVARAQLHQSRADLDAARIDLEATAITAHWDGDDEERVIGQRWVDVGETLEPGQAVVSVLAIDPLEAGIQVTEHAYGRIALGQAASLATDAWPGEAFAAEVVRIAPRFNPASRQAPIELRVPNPDRRLKPGMFVRVELVLARHEDATLVPEAALVGRQGEPAVFAVDETGTSVRRVPVVLGLRDGQRVAVTGEGLTDRVVVLGHHLIGDGSAITIADDDHAGPGDEAEPAP